MGFMDFLDPERADEVKKLKEELADVSYNLKRVMEYVKLDYEKHPLLEITPEVFGYLKDGDDRAAVEAFARTHQVDHESAAKAVARTKEKLGMGPLNYSS